MVTCPGCGRSVGGAARVCAYCGRSLMMDYFGENKDKEVSSVPTPGGIAASILGACGAGVLLVSLMLQVFTLFGLGGTQMTLSDLNIEWWIRTLMMAIAPSILLVQEIMMRGRRLSLVFDSFWLFCATCGFSITSQALFKHGAEAFFNVKFIAYFLVFGCILVCISSVTGILSFRNS